MSTIITPLTGALVIGLAAASPVITPPTGELGLQGSVPTQNIALTPASGALTVAGVNPALVHAIHVTPGTGSLALQGIAPTVSGTASREITPPTGALAMAGTVPIQGFRVIPETGSLVFGDYVLHQIAPPTGSLALAGAAPDIENTNLPTSRTPTTGALGFTGAAPTVGRGTVIIPPTGALVMEPPTIVWTWEQTGGDPVTDWRFEYGRVSGVYTQYTIVEDETLREIVAREVITFGPGPWYVSIVAVANGVLGTRSAEILVDPGIVTLQVDTPRTPTTGALTLSGVAPSIPGGSNTPIQPPVGALALAGDAPTLFHQALVTPPSGTLNLTGVAPELSSPCTITPPTGALALIGYTPSATLTDIRITPSSGALGMAGVAPSVDAPEFITRLITPPGASLTIEGVAPVLGMGTGIPPPTGTLEIVGSAPEIRTPVEITPPTGQLGLDSQAPERVIGPLTIPPTGSLALAGAAPTLRTNTILTPPTGAMQATGATGTILVSAEVVRIPPWALILCPKCHDLYVVDPRFAHRCGRRRR